MATIISEYFGYRPSDHSQEALEAASHEHCPFIDGKCTKVIGGGLVAGVCSLKPVRSAPVICCPNRLYANNHGFLQDVADRAFGPGFPLYAGRSAYTKALNSGASTIAVWGKGYGGELRLPQRKGVGNYFVDWIMAKLDAGGGLEHFVAVEVQSIDTTGNYRDGLAALRNNRQVVANSAGFNWENVAKRIIPQLLYKGHVLQREDKCQRGLFFVSPGPVYERIMARLGGQSSLISYPMKSSTITFMTYDLDFANPVPGSPAPLRLGQVFTTDTGQVATAFAGQGVMPPADSYQDAILAALT